MAVYYLLNAPLFGFFRQSTTLFDHFFLLAVARLGERSCAKFCRANLRQAACANLRKSAASKNINRYKCRSSILLRTKMQQ
jgi:hypothetical protein